MINDPYEFAMNKTDSQMEKIVNYLAQVDSQGSPFVDNSVWGILNRELIVRKRLPSQFVVNIPLYWSAQSMTETPVRFVIISRSSRDFQDLSNYFINSLGKSSVVIYSIIRIENLRLWHIYQDLQKTIPHGSTRLIHGTASTYNQKKIMYHGFCQSYCDNGLIGDGIYFATHASYSNNDPYVMKKNEHRRELFICQVLLGNSSQGARGMKSPASGCHSVYSMDGNTNDQFCIFDHNQAYPEYLVQYDYE
ncbi:unnamed protein product [Rotaria sp. Silwood2]|nr:unnamed protein product [Rotaria sp. Silwood2]CAF3189316.1 unnamed protein product [Rotaria sp. Silwood2]CAF4125264.1 unnamed protein product [Rotaria sp. Silwood2]CAF4305781.1 unnamed protein product [Rotaria sp. Silwood2]CAF4574155.1 unnamed protein product [Rotaria sp. Silwood2]